MKDVTTAVALLERANARLRPDELSRPDSRAILDAYSKAQKLCGFGMAALAPSVDDPTVVARTTGTSVGRAREVLSTGAVLKGAPALGEALQKGKVSLDQAAEIARAEEASPGCSRELLKVARDDSFQVLKDRARKIKLEAEQHKDLATRQREARRAKSHMDPLGMFHVHLTFEPHVGAPIVATAEADAERLMKAAKAAARAAGDGTGAAPEPFERYLCDAYGALLAGGTGKGRAKRPDVTILVSHTIAKRGWKDVKGGEVCKIPGVGPVSPETAREIAKDAFLNGVFYDGKDLRHFKRWSRAIPVEVRAALELGEPPGFDGLECSDCGNRFRNEIDHIDPFASGGETSYANNEPRCNLCHKRKTERDRMAGKLTPLKPRPELAAPTRAQPGRRRQRSATGG